MYSKIIKECGDNEGEYLNTTVLFTKINMFRIYFTVIIFVSKSFLQVKSNYVIPALIGFSLNLIILASILSIGSVIATVSQLLILLYLVYKKDIDIGLLLTLKINI